MTARKNAPRYVLLTAALMIGGCADRTPPDLSQIKVLRDANLVETRYLELLESTPDGIVLANPTGHIVFANGQAETLFGYGPGELRGKRAPFVFFALVGTTRNFHALYCVGFTSAAAL